MMRKDSMNVFQPTGYMPKYLVTHPWKWIKIKVREIKYAYQRIVHGFADVDVCNIDIWFAHVFPRMMERLADITDAYPETEDFPNYFSWVIWLREMARKIRTYYSDKNEDMSEFKEAMQEITKHMDKLWL